MGMTLYVTVVAASLAALFALVFDNVREYRRRLKAETLLADVQEELAESREVALQLANALWEYLDLTGSIPRDDEIHYMIEAGIPAAHIDMLIEEPKENRGG